MRVCSYQEPGCAMTPRTPRRRLRGIAAALLATLALSCGQGAAPAEPARGAASSSATVARDQPALAGTVSATPASGPRPAAADASGPRPVLQLASGGGLGGFPPRSDRVTSVTLWDDGRALFGAPGAAPYREARLGRDAVARLLASADVLYGMADFYAAAAITDAGSTGFTIERARGRKSVEVYALGLDAA